MLINFLNAERYLDSLEKYYRNGLRDFVKHHKDFILVENSRGGDIILDISFMFVQKVKHMRGIKVCVFSEALDEYPVKGFSSGRKCVDEYGKYYDYIFFADNTTLDNARYFYTKFGYCPYTHFPVQRDKRIDVSFVGTNANRDWIRKIPNIKIYGEGWGENIIHVHGAKRRSITAKSRISLNVHHNATHSTTRDCELLAMHSFVLSDVIPKELEGGMVKYNSFDDLCKKIDYYLEHEREREEIAEKGYSLVRPFTYEKRIEEMMGVIKK